MTPNEFLLTLREAATAANGEVRRLADARLEEYRSTDAFLPTIMQLIGDISIDANTRIIALVYLRQLVPGLCSRRGGIPSGMLSALHVSLMDVYPRESDPRVAAQVTVLMGRMARYDWPEQWPELFQYISNLFGSGAELKAYELLHDVLTELSSRRLRNDRIALETECYSLLGAISELWIRQVSTLLASNDGLSVCIEGAKCITILLEIIPAIDECPDTLKLFPKLHELLGIIHGDLNLHMLTGAVMETITTAQKEHPVPFRVYLVPFLELFFVHILEYADRCGTESTYIRDCLLFMRNSVKDAATDNRIILNREQRVKSNSTAADELKNLEHHFFSGQRLSTLTETLLSKYLILSRETLTLWDCDPVAFHLASLADNPSLLRGATTALLSTLVSHHMQDTVPTILSYFEQSFQDGICSLDTMAPDAFLNLLLCRDAALTALGLASFEIGGDLKLKQPIREFIDTLLIPEMKGNVGEVHKIIRRRLALFIGNWFSVHTLPHSVARELIYPMVMYFCQDTDLGVRLGGVWSLGQLVDNSSFHSDVFSSVAEPAFGTMISCFLDIDEPEVRSDVLRSLSILIGTLKDEVLPYAESILARLPELWQACEEQNILRSSLIMILQNLVIALKHQCSVLAPFVCNILSITANIDNECSVYLLEPSLDLWLALLENLNTPNPPVNDMFSYWGKIMESGNIEHVIILLSLLESYVLLGGKSFVDSHAAYLNSLIINISSQVIDKALIKICSTVDTICCALQSNSSLTFGPLILHFLGVLLGECSHSDRVIAHMLSLVARIMFQEFTACVQLLQSEGDYLIRLLQLFISKFDSIDLPYQRKVCALVLCQFIPDPDSSVHKLLNEIITICTGVVYEFTTDSLELNIPIAPDQWTESERRASLAMNDRVNSIKIKDFLSSNLNEAEALYGKQGFNTILTQYVDPNILSQLLDILNRHVRL